MSGQREKGGVGGEVGSRSGRGGGGVTAFRRGARGNQRSFVEGTGRAFISAAFLSTEANVVVVVVVEASAFCSRLSVLASVSVAVGRTVFAVGPTRVMNVKMPASFI